MAFYPAPLPLEAPLRSSLSTLMRYGHFHHRLASNTLWQSLCRDAAHRVNNYDLLRDFSQFSTRHLGRVAVWHVLMPSPALYRIVIFSADQALHFELRSNVSETRYH